jgi:hypothetical protein
MSVRDDQFYIQNMNCFTVSTIDIERRCLTVTKELELINNLPDTEMLPMRG